MIEFKIGQKLYYINKYIQPVFGKIVGISKTQIIFETEAGKKFYVNKQDIHNNKITAFVDTTTESYLKCVCGSMRFQYDSEKKSLYCNTCGIVYENDEMNMLEPTEYIKDIVDEDKILN